MARTPRRSSTAVVDPPEGGEALVAAAAVIDRAEQARARRESEPRKPLTAIERRDLGVISLQTQKSRSKDYFDKVLTAAAMVMDPDNPPDGGWPQPNSVTRTWQHSAWGYSRSVPELNAAKMFVGNCLSRCKLVVGKRNPDGSVEQGFDGDEPAEGLDGALANEAAEYVYKLATPRGGQSEILRAFGERIFIAGECYLVPEDLPSGLVFEVLSTQELIQEGKQWKKFYGPGWGEEMLAPGTKPIRVWRQDGQYQMLATSSVRSCLEILEELTVLTRLVRASAISRMSLAGVLLLPDELDTPDDGASADGNLSEQHNPLITDIVNTGAKAIDDPASAAAWMPFILQGPSEYLKEVRHVAFQADDSEHVIKRTEAVDRLARGLDLPPEKVLGHMGCVDPTTEIMTSQGWRSGHELMVGDEVLTLNHETGLAEWQTVERVSFYDADGIGMMSLEGRSHSSLSTLNHTWPVMTQRGARRIYQSDALNTNCRIIPAAPVGDLPTEAKHADTLVELIAWYFTEGTDHDGGGATIYQSHTANPHHVVNIRRALRDLVGDESETMYRASRASGRSECSFSGCGWPVHGKGFCNAHRAQERQGIALRPVRRHSPHPEFVDDRGPAWREVRGENMTQFRLNKVLADEIRRLAPDKVPTFDFLRSLTAAQLELFIRRAVDGDGWSRDDLRRIQFHQSDRRRTEAFEFALLLSGRAVTERTSRSTGGFKDSVRHQVLSRDATPHRVGFGIRKQLVPYVGQVWCPTVANGTWLARRNGTVYFTGNTTYANAGQVSEDNFNLYIEPALQMICDALTVAYLWPAMAASRGIDADHLKDAPWPDDITQVCITYDARRLISKPDRSKEIVDVYLHDLTFCAVAIAEVREAVGLDPSKPPDDVEVAKRIDAYRLGRIREVIQAPAGDAAVPIADASAGNAPIPGQSEGARLAGQPVVSPVAREEALLASSSLDPLRFLSVQIASAAELTIDRALERLGARVRAKGVRSLTTAERAAIDGVANSSVARLLGPESVARILGPGDDPTLAEIAVFTRKVSAWAHEAECDDVSRIAGEATAIATTLIRRAIFEEPLAVTPDLFGEAIFGVRVGA